MCSCDEVVKRRWHRPGLLAVAVAVLGGLVALPTVAGAQTYTYTGSEQTFSVPAGVTGVHVVLAGATGSLVSVSGVGGPGYGARLTADIPVPAGTTKLYVEVGGVGMQANPPSEPYSATGGWNGGGSGPFGGGGATDIRTTSCGSASGCATGGSQASLSSRLAVAGGGGAPGADGEAGAVSAGYADGGSAGVYSNGSGAAGAPAISGLGASVTSPGQPDSQTNVSAECTYHGGAGGEVGLAGSLGTGGAGAYAFINGANSGGGGGGLYGGGGGAQCYTNGAKAIVFAGAGGAGSSGAPSGQDVLVATALGDPASAELTAPVPTHTAPPTITGNPTVGDVLTERHGTWTSSLPITSYTFRWERCDSGSGSCTAIGGANRRTYRPQADDVGHRLRVQETASNFYGDASTPTTSDATEVISAPSSPGTNPPPSGTSPGSGTPVLSRLRVSPRSLSVAGRRIHGRCVRPSRSNARDRRCQRPIRLNISYSLTAAAGIAFTVVEEVLGRMTHGRCVKATLRNRRQRRCTRSLAVRAKVTRAGKAGTNSFVFNGWLGGRRLGPGTYELIARPAGGKLRTATFKILR